MMPKRLQVGDWVKFLALDGMHTGYIDQMIWRYGTIRVRAIDLGKREYVQCSPAIVFPFSENELTAEDLDNLIDLTLEIGDKQWFMELTGRRKELTEKHNCAQ
ncbi:IDEAL domain-containing protein [Bacillaceae bacterium Marseille-Q3522]|nr:IDEAL domain-containing protein [Bacillaceae bacterium Marseille-Q3522]